MTAVLTSVQKEGGGFRILIINGNSKVLLGKYRRIGNVP